MERVRLKSRRGFVELSDGKYPQYDGSIYSKEFPMALRSVFQRHFGTDMPSFHKKQIDGIIRELKKMKKPIE
jgi:hypothetical protein